MRWLLLLLVGCAVVEPEVEAPPEPTPAPFDGEWGACDAGDAAWIRRASTALTGRRPRGMPETGPWLAAVAEHGRAGAAAAMMQDADFADRWTDFVLDALQVGRFGYGAQPACYRDRGLPEDRLQELAAWLGSAASDEDFGEAFTTADVLRAAVLGDDLSIAWRVHLITRLNAQAIGCVNPSPLERERANRKAQGAQFFGSYLHRDQACLGCHNSAWSTTDDPDPDLDRTWQIPGQFERAIFDDPTGPAGGDAWQPHRRLDVWVEDGVRPWGLDPACGLYAPAGSIPDDPLGFESFFVRPLGGTGSSWDLEEALHVGVESLAGSGLDVGDELALAGEQAFAYLVGTAIVDRVWEDAVGAPLGLSHGFPRNQAQMALLQGLTDVLVESGFSLRALLTAVVEHPLFNAGPPASCEAVAHGMPAVFEPFSPESEDPDRRGNGSGDRVAALSARTLLRSVHDAMGWPVPAPLTSLGFEHRAGQLGAFTQSSAPGSDAVDLGGLLIFETVYGAGVYPQEFEPGCFGVFRVLEEEGMPGASCEACVCDIEPSCCEEPTWVEGCADLCRDACGGCEGHAAITEQDVVSRLLAGGGTVEQVLAALSDRLLGRGELSDDERALYAELLGVGMEEEATAELEPALRHAAVALLLSPQFQLDAVGELSTEAPERALDGEVECSRINGQLAEVGLDPVCG